MYICMYMYICKFVFICACEYICELVCASVYTCLCLDVQCYVLVSVWVYVWTLVFMLVYCIPTCTRACFNMPLYWALYVLWLSAIPCEIHLYLWVTSSTLKVAGENNSTRSNFCSNLFPASVVAPYSLFSEQQFDLSRKSHHVTPLLKSFQWLSSQGKNK